MTAVARARMLPYGRQTIGEDDIVAVAAALRADLLTTGPLVEEFETAFAQATGARYAVACNSGTAALHLAVLALGLGPGDVAIAPSITFAATANVVRFCGAEVVFADVDADTGMLTPETLEKSLARAKKIGRLKAVLPVHLNGSLCDMEGLAAIAHANGAVLVEDACHALGVAKVGEARYSRAACFSTHPVKAIATGEGGVITTADAVLAERMRLLRSHGIHRNPNAFRNVEFAFDGGALNPWYYEMSELGWNYRLPDILCALGLSQLRKLPKFHSRRQAIAKLYDRLLASLAPDVRPAPHSDLHGWHLYPVLIDFERLHVSRRSLMDTLLEAGIGTQVHYIPVHRQPYYVDRYGTLDLPGGDRYYERCLSIPMFPAMTDSDVEYVVAKLSDAIRRRE
jgi:UDP-4-amino-4,6-dideoxy-N-acetyl-beta-L-altrosamine transaminase